MTMGTREKIERIMKDDFQYENVFLLLYNIFSNDSAMRHTKKIKRDKLIWGTLL